MKTTRCARGCYTTECGGRTYDIDRDDYGLWVVYSVADGPTGVVREYLQDYRTLRAALAALAAHHSDWRA